METSGYYADRVASEGVLKNCGIDGKNYHIRYKHIVNDQTRLDYVMVAVTSTAARDAVMRQSTIYHVSIFLGCLAAALIVVAVIVKVFRPIGQLTELLYDTCALFFGRKLDSYGSVDDGLVSELSSIRDGSSASNTRPNIGNFGLKGGTPESGLNTPSATSAVTPSSSSSSGIVDLVQVSFSKN